MATVPIDLKKLHDAVDNDVVKKDGFEKLVKKFNVKGINIKGAEDKILSSTNLSDTAAVTAVENKIPTLAL